MENDKTIEESVTATTPFNGSRNDYDVLAYFADFTYCSGNLVQNVAQRLLLSIFVDNTKQNFPIQSNSGAASQVFVMKSAHFLEPALGESTANPLPEIIAVKRRTVKGSRNSIRDWRPLKSLSTELRILTDRDIRDHPNIVNFLGNCWQYADDEHTLILPVMIFEATTLGDLQTYHDQHPDLTLGLQLQLGLGVTRGVAGLHEAGIIHCDVKPKNVLVFRQDDTTCPIIPKLIDFDLAILHQDAPDRVTPPQGTKVWNSPEQADDRDAIQKNDLFKIDIFSLAMVLLNLLTSNFLSRYISAFGNPGSERLTGGLTVQQFKRTGSLAMNASNFLKDFANISGPEGSNDEFSAFRVLWMRAAKILTRALDGDFRHRINSAVEIERELQRLLEDVKDAELLDYHNEEVAISSKRKGDMSIFLNTGT
jgi:serine/threonine protein kinase